VRYGNRIDYAYLVEERSLQKQSGTEAMEDRERQFTTNDLGLVLFILVAGWLLLFQSGLIL
jgi:hypothetical protein